MQLKLFSDRFCENTAIHGFAHFKQQKYLPSKIVWLIVILLVFSILLFHLTLLAGEYLQYNYEEKMEFTEDHVFPDVVVCPLAQTLNTEILHRGSEGAANNQYWNLMHKDADLTNFTGSTLSDYFKYEVVKFVNLNQKQKRLIEKDTDDVIVFSIFNNENITNDQIKSKLTAIAFQCFLFQFEQTPEMYYEYQFHAIMFHGGETHEKYHRFNQLFYTNMYGFKIFIKKPGASLQPMTTSIGVDTGIATKITVKQTHYKRLGAPYFECSHYNENIPDTFYCQFECISKLIYRKCGCNSFGHQDLIT